MPSEMTRNTCLLHFESCWKERKKYLDVTLQNNNWHLIQRHMFLIFDHKPFSKILYNVAEPYVPNEHMDGAWHVSLSSFLSLPFRLSPSFPLSCHSGCWAGELAGIGGGGWGGSVEPGAPGLPGEPGQDELDAQRGDRGAREPRSLHAASQPEPQQQELLAAGRTWGWGRGRARRCRHRDVRHGQRGRAGTTEDVQWVTVN